MKTGFTLIELSVVLVIIGLIAGGILTGRDLINAAAIRAQISQIEKYNTAMRTFQNKYGYLPGDIPNPYATQFGFQSRGIYPGEGDGNGIIAGITGSGCASPGVCDNGNMESAGEIPVFWGDLSKAGLIEGSFTTASTDSTPASDITGAAINSYLPQAKIGQGNYIYIWAGGSYTSQWNYTGINYFTISAVNNIAANTNYGKIYSSAALTVFQAYSMDKKVDDGYPQTGKIITIYMGNVGTNGDPVWPDGTDYLWSPPNTGATSGSPATCYDNGNVAGTQKYSMEENGGSGLNCALSFQFQ